MDWVQLLLAFISLISYVQILADYRYAIGARNAGVEALGRAELRRWPPPLLRVHLLVILYIGKSYKRQSLITVTGTTILYFFLS